MNLGSPKTWYTFTGPENKMCKVLSRVKIVKYSGIPEGLAILGKIFPD